MGKKGQKSKKKKKEEKREEGKKIIKIGGIFSEYKRWEGRDNQDERGRSRKIIIK